MDKIVKNDGKALSELLKLDAGTLEHQGHYCFMASKDDNRVDIYCEQVDEQGSEMRITEVLIDDEPQELCEWCGDLFLRSEIKQDESFGNLCNKCSRAIASRG